MFHLTRRSVKLLLHYKTFKRVKAIEEFNRLHIYSDPVFFRFFSSMTTQRPGWNETSLELYNKLLENAKAGKWKKILTTRDPPPVKPDFARLTLLDPVPYEYGIFISDEEQCLNGVCEFGYDAQGPLEHAHGGAIATIIDGATQLLKAALFPDVLSVTGNLKVNYKKPIPIGSTVFIESHLEKRDGKKFFLSCNLKSADESVLYDTGTTLFFDVNTPVDYAPSNIDFTPNPVTGWTEESERVCKQIREELDNQTWKLLKTTKVPPTRKVFARIPIGPGLGFEYAWFINEDTMEVRGFCQFGPYTQGPDGLVHGGATATMIDSIVGVMVNYMPHKKAVTANLDIKYKLPVPIGSTVQVEAKLDRVDGCKYYMQCTLLTSDRSKVLVTGTSLFIDLAQLYKL